MGEREPPAALEEARDRAAHDSRFGQLLSIVSHDLRSPLTALLLGSRLVGRERAISDTTRQVAAEMEEAAEELQRRVLDFIDLSRALHGALIVSPAALEFGDLCRGAVREADRRARQRGLHLDVETHTVLVRGEGRILPRTIVALIDHGLQHSPAGAHVSVWVGPSDGGGLVRVVDAGPPLAPAVQAAFFEPVPTSGGGRTAGGCSLALVKTLAGLLGGRAWAENAASGAILHLWLPAAS